MAQKGYHAAITIICTLFNMFGKRRKMFNFIKLKKSLHILSIKPDVSVCLGADMVIYLLEKSRLTYQQSLERCYHSFYNLMSDAVPDLKAKCFLSNDIRDYHYVSQVIYSFKRLINNWIFQFR